MYMFHRFLCYSRYRNAVSMTQISTPNGQSYVVITTENDSQRTNKDKTDTIKNADIKVSLKYNDVENTVMS